jgi:vancomycin resistance protein YoaR
MSRVNTRQTVVVVRRRDSQQAKRPRRLPWAPLFVVLLLVAMGIALVRWEETMVAAVYPGVHVGGVDVGGLSLDVARGRLTPLADSAMNRTLTVTAGTHHWTMTPQGLGLHLDLDAKLQQAYALGREPNAIDRYGTQLSLAVEGRDLPLLGNYDSGLLDAFVQKAAIAVYQAPQAASVRLANGQATLTAHAHPGDALDQPAATKLLAEALADTSQATVKLPVKVLPPPVSEAEGEREVAALQTLLTHTTVTMQFGGKSWKMGARTIGPLISLTTVVASGGASTYQHNVNQKAVADYVDRLAAHVDQPVHDATATVTAGRIHVTAAQSGYHLDRFTTQKVIAQAILAGGPQTVTLPVGVTAPVGTTSAAEAAAQQAGALIRRPLALTYATGRQVLSSAELGSLLTFTPHQDPISGPQVIVGINTTKLATVIAPVTATLNQAPINARFAMVGTSVKVVPSQPGTQVDLKVLAADLLARNNAADIAVPLQPIQAHFTTSAAQAMGIHDLLISHSTYFPGSSPARLTNIDAAVHHLDGQLIAPGAVYSFNQRIGDITAQGGYVEGIDIIDNEDVPGIGGGVCQVAVTLFQAAVYTGMPIVERVAHANVVSYYNPVGMDATVYVSPDGPDVKFQNNTGHWVLVRFVEDLAHNKLTVRFYGTNPHFHVVVRGPTSTTEPNGDVDAVFYRTVYNSSGKELLNAHFNSHYVPEGAAT